MTKSMLASAWNVKEKNVRSKRKKIQKGDLVTVTNPISLKEMSIVGIAIDQSGRFIDVYIPDVSRSIAFDEIQLEKIV